MRRGEIVAAAVEPISQRGISKVSRQQLADGAELWESLIYVHFESKQALIHELTPAALEALLRRTQSALEGIGSLERRGVEMARRCRLRVRTVLAGLRPD